MSAIFVDRRVLNQERNMDNRRKFFNRVRFQLLSSVKDLGNDNISDITKTKRTVSLSEESIEEPCFTYSKTGTWKYVLSGNSYIEKDRIGRPPQGNGKGRGKDASEDGEGNDEFVFEVNQEEFLQLFFEDLELPNMTNKAIQRSEVFSWQRKGFSTSGAPCNMDLRRTIKNSLGRRIALKRPKIEDLEKKEDETVEEHKLRVARRKTIPFIDPIDLRFRNYEQQPVPSFSAVVFFLMDVSYSMSESKKDLAKRFFMLKYFFLQRKYTNVDIVFISHTHAAKEVEEQEFFYGTDTGGTIVLPALKLANKIIQDRYPINEWNVYIAQASDGDCFGADGEQCVEYLSKQLLPITQFMCYLNVSDGDNSIGYVPALMNHYKSIQAENFAMVEARHRRDIFPVFKKLFQKNKVGA